MESGPPGSAAEGTPGQSLSSAATPPAMPMPLGSCLPSVSGAACLSHCCFLASSPQLAVFPHPFRFVDLAITKLLAINW